jgi:hypothetical protein
MSLESILRAVPGLSPHDRRKMLQAAAGTAKTKNVAALDAHLVRRALNTAHIGGMNVHHVEAVIEALQNAGLVGDEAEATN